MNERSKANQGDLRQQRVDAKLTRLGIVIGLSRVSVHVSDTIQRYHRITTTDILNTTRCINLARIVATAVAGVVAEVVAAAATGITRTTRINRSMAQITTTTHRQTSGITSLPHPPRRPG